MSRRDIVNVPASIRNKLLNKARTTKRPFLELLQYFAIERFLYRLSVSKHAHKFFLKGALMFKVWKAIDHRPTMDIDLLGKTTNSPENLTNIFQEICQQRTDPNDGIIFLPDSILSKAIQIEAEYEGIRIEFIGDLNKAIVNMQIDIGFGDVITPGPISLNYPTILDLPAPRLQGYTIESVISEKFEAMVKRGMNNSRMKDFFDIWTLSKQYSIDKKILIDAIETTFTQRGTTLDSDPVCFSKTFVNDSIKNAQWKAFTRKNQLTFVSENFAEIVMQIQQTLAPVLQRI